MLPGNTEVHVPHTWAGGYRTQDLRQSDNKTSEFTSELQVILPRAPQPAGATLEFLPWAADLLNWLERAASNNPCRKGV